MLTLSEIQVTKVYKKSIKISSLFQNWKLENSPNYILEPGLVGGVGVVQ